MILLVLIVANFGSTLEHDVKITIVFLLCILMVNLRINNSKDKSNVLNNHFKSESVFTKEDLSKIPNMADTETPVLCFQSLHSIWYTTFTFYS